MRFFWTFIACLSFLGSLSAKSERTLSIIKPDAVKAQHIGDILALFEHAGLSVADLQLVTLTQSQAENFYAVHKERPFYASLVEFMTSGPVVFLILEGDDAIVKTRNVMGATDPKQATPGTIRATFGTTISYNAVHGSDSLENAEKEIDFFYSLKSAPK